MRNFSSLDQAVSEQAQRSPDKLFIRDLSQLGQDTRYSYFQADNLINSLTMQINKLAEENIGVMLSTSYECICLIYAIIRSGRNPVLLDPEWGEAAKESIIREMGLLHLVADHKILGQLQKLQLELAFEKAQKEKTGLLLSRGSKTKIYIFTSGTTSKPKGIELTQAAMLYAYQVGQKCLGINENTNAGCFYRVSGLGILGINFLFPILFGGSTTILQPYSYFVPNEFFDDALRYGVNFLYIVPPIASFIVKEGKGLKKPFTTDEILCVAGSSRLDPQIQQMFQDNYGPLANIYGLSECGFAFLFGEKKDDRFTNSVGCPVGIEAKILDDNGVEVKQFETQGTLHIKTSSLFNGYVNNIELTQSVVNDGWINTKDLAWFDKNGAIHLIGRFDGTIKKGGNLFHLSECEELLHSLATVTEACCVKVPCELYGQDYLVFARLNSQQSELELKEILEKSLGVARAPRKVIITKDPLPRNGAGKYNAAKLLAMEQ